MRARWFRGLPDDKALGPSLRELIWGITKVLDRLRPPAVASGSGFVALDVSAVVVPHARIPGCSLVLQISDWSSIVGCWWSKRTDPSEGPPTLELFAEFPLDPDGIAHAVAWFAEELRRPVVERVRRFGIVCRREWLVVLDDDYQQSLWREWLPWWRRPPWAHKAVDERETGWLAEPARAREGEKAGKATAGEDVSLTGDRWLLVAAGMTAAVAWILLVTWPVLDSVAWAPLAIRVLRVAAFAMLFTWFGIAALDHPRRLRAPMSVGLGLSMLRPGLGFLPGSGVLPSGTESALQTLGMWLREWWPDLLGVAALVCFLVAFLGTPTRKGPQWWQSRVLPVAVLACLVDLAVGLRWLAPVVPASDANPTLTLLGVLVVAGRAVAVGIAVALLVVMVLERRAGMAAGAVRAGVAGGALLAVAWGNMAVVGLARLGGWLGPVLLTRAISSLPFGLALFAGTALIAFAAVRTPLAPLARSRQGRRASTLFLPRAPTR